MHRAFREWGACFGEKFEPSEAHRHRRTGLLGGVGEKLEPPEAHRHRRTRLLGVGFGEKFEPPKAHRRKRTDFFKRERGGRFLVRTSKAHPQTLRVFSI